MWMSSYSAVILRDCFSNYGPNTSITIAWSEITISKFFLVSRFIIIHCFIHFFNQTSFFSKVGAIILAIRLRILLDGDIELNPRHSPICRKDKKEAFSCLTQFQPKLDPNPVLLHPHDNPILSNKGRTTHKHPTLIFDNVKGIMIGTSMLLIHFCTQSLRATS